MRVLWIGLAAALVACGVAGNGAGGGSGNGTQGGSGSGSGSGGGGSGGSGGGGSGGADMALDPQLDLFMSGTRLKLKVLTTPDGARAFQGWHDAQLGVDCQFLPAADGQTRCLPLGAYIGTFYADSGCSTKLGYIGCAGATPPPYAYLTTVAGNGSCTGGYQIYSVNGVYSGTVYVGSPGSCSMADPPTYASYTLLSLGGEVPLSTFVAGSVSVQ